MMGRNYTDPEYDKDTGLTGHEQSVIKFAELKGSNMKEIAGIVKAYPRQVRQVQKYLDKDKSKNNQHEHVWVYDETLSTHPVRCKTCGIYRQNQANMILVKRGRRV